MKQHKLSKILACVLCLTMVAGVLSGCSKNEKIELSIENNIVEVLPDQEYQLLIDSNLKNMDEIVLEIIKGKEQAEITNQRTLKVKGSATPEEKIEIIAKKSGIKSNVLTLQVGHIEATQVILSLSNTTCVAGESVEINSIVSPANYTRKLEYIISDPSLASLVQDCLVISPTAKDGDSFTIKSKVGNVKSQEITVNVIKFNESDVLDIIFSGEGEISNNMIELDTSTGNNVATVTAKLLLNDGDSFKEINNKDITYTIDDDSIISYQNGTISAKKNGETNINAFYGNHSTLIHVKVLMRPNYIGTPTDFSQPITYYYTKGSTIPSIKPNIIQDNGCDDYTVRIYSKGTLQAKYSVIDNNLNEEIKSENIVYTNTNELSILNVGEYEVKFASLSGCKNERESTPLKIMINEGVNVSNKAEYLTYMNGTSYPVVNIVNDIVFENGKEETISYGDKEVNGNGHTIDLTKQILGLNAYYDSGFMGFKTINNYTPMNITLRDFNLVCNYGYLGAEEISKITGDTPEDIRANKTTDYFKYISYRSAIILDVTNRLDGGSAAVEQYGVIIPQINNISISGFMAGIRAWSLYDETAITEQGTPGINNIRFNNIFGDGLGLIASQIRVGNIECGTIGGAPIVENGPELNYNAGPHFNEKAVIKFAESIQSENLVDGSSLYMYYEMKSDETAGKLFDIANGLSGIISIVISTKISQIKAQYPRDKVMLAKIDSAKTNILKRIGDTDFYNLLTFQTTNSNVISRDKNLESQFLVLDDTFIINGINTTHKFIELKVYDILISLDGAIADLAKSLKEQLEGYKIILANHNYQEDKGF